MALAGLILCRSIWKDEERLRGRCKSWQGLSSQNAIWLCLRGKRNIKNNAAFIPKTHFITHFQRHSGI